MRMEKEHGLAIITIIWLVSHIFFGMLLVLVLSYH